MPNTLRWSKEQYAAHQAKHVARAVLTLEPDPRPKYRSQLEAEYAGVLEMRRRAGEIQEYGYERITLWLHGRIRYTPDFDVLLFTGEVELHECKGWNRESGRNKLRAAVETFPRFHWYIVGTNKTPTRLRKPQDVPAIAKVVR